MNFSSQSLHPGSNRPVSLDSSDKSREKREMIGVNDLFVKRINKVKELENENKKLIEKLRILRNKENYDGRVDDIIRQKENELEELLNRTRLDQEKLKEELANKEKEKKKTEDLCNAERAKCTKTEGDCILLKKEVDKANLLTVDLTLQREILNEKLEVFRAAFDEELKELESQVMNEHKVITGSSQRSLDLEEVVKTVEAQYANMANQAKEEAERWNQKKMTVLMTSAGQREQEVRDQKRIISDLLRIIQTLKSEKDNLKRQEEAMKRESDNLRREGDGGIEGVRKEISELEAALRMTKQELAQQVRDHQELLNLKLALDIEIETYRRLLEGEEERIKDYMSYNDVRQSSEPQKSLSRETIVAADSINASNYQEMSAGSPSTKKRLLIRLDVESGRVVSTSSQYTD